MGPVHRQTTHVFLDSVGGTAQHRNRPLLCAETACSFTGATSHSAFDAEISNPFFPETIAGNKLVVVDAVDVVEVVDVVELETVCSRWITEAVSDSSGPAHTKDLSLYVLHIDSELRCTDLACWSLAECCWMRQSVPWSQ